MYDEEIPENNYTIFDPDNIWRKKTLVNYYVKPLQEQIFKSGELVYTMPTLNEISKKREAELNTLWDEVIRIKNPHKYYVDLSDKLWNLKNKMIKEHQKN